MYSKGSETVQLTVKRYTCTTS